jgi:proliferating cell nuclear antigen
MPTFRAKTADAILWKTVVNTIATLVEEASFEANENGISFRAMDPSHVALLDLFWPSTAFEQYEVSGLTKFTVRVEDLLKLLKNADPGESVEASITEEELLKIRFSNSYSKEYFLNLIEATAGTTPIPNVTFDTRVVVTEDRFEKILRDIEVISDHMVSEATKDGLILRGKSDMGSVTITLDKTSPELLEFEVKQPSRATYRLDFLTSITKAAGKSSQTVTFEFSTKKPLRLEFKLGELGGRIWFYLAPLAEV